MPARYRGLAWVCQPSGLEVRVGASLRADEDGWGGELAGPADWLGIAASPEPFFALRLPSGRSGAAFVSELDRDGRPDRVAIEGVGAPPFD